MLKKLSLLGIALVMLSGMSCAQNMVVVSDFCLVADPDDLTDQGLAKYDCLCSDEPIDEENCKGE